VSSADDRGAEQNSFPEEQNKRGNHHPPTTDFGGCMINRIKTRWVLEFISIAFSFLTTLLIATVSDIVKERTAKRAGTGSPESHSGAEQ
jgi:hypothetical protein